MWTEQIWAGHWIKEGLTSVGKCFAKQEPGKYHNHHRRRRHVMSCAASVVRCGATRAQIGVSRPSRRVDANRVAVRPVRAKAVPTGADVENGTIDLVVSTEEARRTLQFDKVILDEREGPVIFVTGVAIGSAAEAAGVTPGQRLVALSDPVNDGELWFIDGTERLAFVNDAIRSTRAYECTVVVESEVSVTKAAVDAVRPPTDEERERDEQRRRNAAKADLGVPPAPPQKKREREDLYSDNWAGDEYTGGTWNELTVGIAIFVAVPALILTLGVTTRGVLWDTGGFF